MILVYILIVLTGCRWAALASRFRWREKTTSFPTACPNWSGRGPYGCSRVTLAASGCVNEGTIPASQYLVYVNTAAEVNAEIANCVRKGQPGKVQQPKRLDTFTNNQGLIHITYNSDIFGFIDDVYITTADFGVGEISVEIQSQIRLRDFLYSMT